jgi:hypothetical protein
VAVVGVGRSGTSAITRGLEALGVELGPDLRSGGGKNPTGFFEDEALADLTRRVRKAVGLRAGAVGLIDAACWQSPEVARLHDEAVATVRQRFGDAPLWGFKHARTLRLLPFWRDVFDALQLDSAYVVAIRNPLSVARSRGALEERRGVQENSDLEWLVNVVPNFPIVRSHPFVVVDYDNLMSEPKVQLERIARQLGLAFGDAERTAVEEYATQFLDGGLRHTRFTPDDLAADPRVNPLTREAYACLHRLAHDEWAADSPDLGSAWSDVEQGLALLAPVLLRLDDVEMELRLARKSLLGPLQNTPRVWRKLRDRFTR